jgi:hypothetical protein
MKKLSEAERRRRVRNAVKFIRERVKEHELRFALEVGEHLFANIYQGNRAYYRRKGPKEDCIALIAEDPGVEVSANTLRMCVRVYLLYQDTRSVRGLPVPELRPWSWNGMWDLEGDPERLAVVATWAARYGISNPLLTAAAQVLHAYLAAGGRVEDLLVGALDEGSSPYMRLKRMSGVVAKWLAAGPTMSPEGRGRALELVDDILRQLRAG